MTETRLSTGQLKDTYGAEIREMEGAAADEKAKPLLQKIEEMETEVTDLKKSSGEKDAKVKELEEQAKSKDKEIAEMKKANDGLVQDKRQRLLDDYKAEKIGALGEKKISQKVQEMISKGVKAEVDPEDDDDLTRSKRAVDEAVETKVTEMEEMAKVTGGTLESKNDGKGGKKKTATVGNPPRKEDVSEQRSDLANAILVGSAVGTSGTDDDDDD